MSDLWYKQVINNLDIIKKKPEFNSWAQGHINILLSKPYRESIEQDIRLFCSNLNSNATILDYGCGAGEISFLLSEINSYNIHAVEYSGEWNIDDQTKTIISAYHDLWKENLKNKPDIIFNFYNKLPIKYPDQSFDAIFLYAVIEHIDDHIIESVMREVHRLLKDNGYLFIAKLPRKLSLQEAAARFLKIGGHSKLFNKKEIKNILLNNHFKIKRIDQTEICFQQPYKVFNKLNFLIRIIELLSNIPVFNTFAHNYRIICKKKIE